MSNKGQTTEKNSLLRCIRPIGVSVFLGAVFCVLALVLLSFVLVVRNVPPLVIQLMAMLALVIGALTSGFFCARWMHEKGLLYGAICGVLFSFVVLASGMAAADNVLGVPALLKTACMLFSSMIGGVLGVNTRPRRRKIKK